MQWDISAEQVPARMMAQIQPGDVGVFDPPMASVGADWLNDKRTDTSTQGAPVRALERLIGAWSEVSRHIVSGSWVKVKSRRYPFPARETRPDFVDIELRQLKSVVHRAYQSTALVLLFTILPEAGTNA